MFDLVSQRRNDLQETAFSIALNLEIMNLGLLPFSPTRHFPGIAEFSMCAESPKNGPETSVILRLDERCHGRNLKRDLWGMDQRVVNETMADRFLNTLAVLIAEM